MGYLEDIRINQLKHLRHTVQTGADNLPDDTYVLYVDGSFDTKERKAGWGFVATVNNKMVFADYGNVSDEIYGSRNITGECFSAVKALEWLDSISATQAVIVFDYKGLGYWAASVWNTKSPVAIKYKERVNRTRVKVDWRHIKGHNGNEWNECADVLAELGKLKATDLFI